MSSTAAPSLPRALSILALGIVLGSGLVFGLRDRLPPASVVDTGDATGTFLARTAVDRLDLIEKRALPEGSLEGTIETRANRGLLLVEIAVRSPDPGTLFLDFDRATLSPRGFNLEDESQGEIRVQPGQFRLEHSGANRYQLTLRRRSNAPASLQLRVVGPEGEESRSELQVGAIGI